MAFTLLADTSARNSTGVGFATTPAINTTAADLLVIIAASDSNATPTDSKSNTWVGLTARTNGSMTCRIWYCNPASGKVGSGHTFTVTATVSSLCVMAFSGAEQVSVFDVENGNTSASASSLATGSITPGVNNELVVTGCVSNNQVVIQSVTGGFSQIDTQQGTTWAFSVSQAYLIQTTAAAANPTWSEASANVMAVAIASFKPSLHYMAPSGGSLALTGGIIGRNYSIAPIGASLTLTGKTPKFAPSLGPLVVEISGVDHTNDVLFDSQIGRDVLNQPATLGFVTINGYNPAVGSSVIVNRGTANIFNGAITTSKQVYAGIPVSSNLRYNITCIDSTYYLRKRLPFASYTNVSATQVATEVVQNYSTLLPDGIQQGLPVITIVLDGSQDVDKCLTDIAQKVGASHYTDNNVVYLFTPSGAEAIPNITDATTDVLNDPQMTVTSDLTQVRTRILVKGIAATSTDSDILASETIIPVKDVSVLLTTGGQVFVPPSSIITYAGARAGGGASNVGPGVSPAAPPSVSLVTGAGMGIGNYQYAEVFVSAQGKTTPGPVASITTVGVSTFPDPTDTLSVTMADNYGNYSGSAPNFNAGGNGPHIGDTVQYAYSFSTSTVPDLLHETNLSPFSPIQTVLAVGQVSLPAGWTVACAPLIVGQVGGPVGQAILAGTIRYVHVWRKLNGGAATKIYTLDGPSTYNNGFFLNDGNSVQESGSVPSPNATVAAKQQVSVTPFSGPSGTVWREIYRTAAGGSQLKLVHTYTDNVDITPFIDSTADGSLGANAPTADTSGLAFAISNGGGFYTTGVTFPTDGAATLATTSAPVFTSVSYTFIAADVGAVLYIASGTNWNPGRYTIVSVSAGAAILNTAVATVSSPTAATWGIDYSAQANPRIAFTDMVIDATTATKFTSAANPVGVNFVGNVIAINFSLGFIQQRVIVKSTAATVATCDKNLGTLSSTGGSGNLGGAPPATSVLPGSTTLLVRDLTAFSSSGGWLSSGSQRVRYTGIDGPSSSVTGIPISGTGSIDTAISYGAVATDLPVITGCTNVIALLSGTSLRLFVQVDNIPAQTALAAIEGGDGVHEDIIDDSSLPTVSACIAAANADLAQFSSAIVTVEFASRNISIHSGKTVTFNRTNPPVTGTYTIQDVTITQMWAAPGPMYTVKASNIKFTLQDLLAQIVSLFKGGK